MHIRKYSRQREREYGENTLKENFFTVRIIYIHRHGEVLYPFTARAMKTTQLLKNNKRRRKLIFEVLEGKIIWDCC